MLKPQQKPELHNGAPQRLLELTFQLPLRDPNPLGNIGNGQRFAYIGFDQVCRGAHAGWQAAFPAAERLTLRCSRRAHRMMNDVVGNLANQFLAMIGFNQVEHQIHGGRRPRACYDFTIERKQLFGRVDTWKLLLKTGKIRPMCCGLLFIQQPGTGKDVARNFQCT